MKKLKLVLDSNLWVSYFFGKHVKKYLDFILIDTRFDLLISQNEINELTKVLKRPKFKKYITEKQVETLISLILQRSILIDVSTQITLSRDSKDDYLLALSFDGHADYLITGDEDLLVLEQFEQTIIIKIADFIAKHT